MLQACLQGSPKWELSRSLRELTETNWLEKVSGALGDEEENSPLNADRFGAPKPSRISDRGRNEQFGKQQQESDLISYILGVLQCLGRACFISPSPSRSTSIDFLLCLATTFLTIPMNSVSWRPFLPIPRMLKSTPTGTWARGETTHGAQPLRAGRKWLQIPSEAGATFLRLISRKDHLWREQGDCPVTHQAAVSAVSLRGRHYLISKLLFALDASSDILSHSLPAFTLDTSVFSVVVWWLGKSSSTKKDKTGIFLKT